MCTVKYSLWTGLVENPHARVHLHVLMLISHTRPRQHKAPSTASHVPTTAHGIQNRPHPNHVAKFSTYPLPAQASSSPPPTATNTLAKRPSQPRPSNRTTRVPPPSPPTMNISGAQNEAHGRRYCHRRDKARGLHEKRATWPSRQAFVTFYAAALSTPTRKR